MGRAKLDMELIKKIKARRVTYKKRKEGLLRKMHEFTTLCGVKACLIIYASPDDTEPDEVWPKNNEEQIRCLINLYGSKGKNAGGNKSYGLVDYFDDRNKKMENELQKLRMKKNEEIKHPSWFDFMSNLSEMELREFGNSLDERIEFVKNRLDLIKRKNLIELGLQYMNQQNSQIYLQQQQPQVQGLIHNGIELELTNQELNSMNPIPPPPAMAAQLQMIHYPIVYNVEHEQHNQSINNQSSRMMLLMNDNVSDAALNFDYGTSNFNSRYESAYGVVENVVYNPRPLTDHCYAVQALPDWYPPQMQYPSFPYGVPPELLRESWLNDGKTPWN